MSTSDDSEWMITRRFWMVLYKLDIWVDGGPTVNKIIAIHDEIVMWKQLHKKYGIPQEEKCTSTTTYTKHT